MVSSSYEDEQADLDALVIQKVNYGLAAAYMILGILAIIQVVVKYKVEKKIKTSVVFPAEIFVLCLVRAIYFILSLTNWTDKRTPGYTPYSSLVLFIDTLPELIYVAIYVLLVASWGVAWGKARRARPFSARQFWCGYAGIVIGMFVVSFILSIISSQSFRLNYENILLWEGAYLIFLCANFLLAAIIFGVKLYSMLKKTAYVGTSSSTMSLLYPQQQSQWSKASTEPPKSTPPSSSSSSSDGYKARVRLGWERAWSGFHSSWSQASSSLSLRSSVDSNSSSSSSRPRPTLASGGEAMLHVMRQLLALVVLVSVSFVLKAACIFGFATSARHEWIYSEWTTSTFAIFWVLYFAISELIPFVLVWIVLQRKDASSSRTTSSYSLNTNATRMSYISGRMSENARRAKERQVNLFVQGEKQVDDKEESSYAYQDASDLG